MSRVPINHDKGQLINYPCSQDGNIYKAILLIKKKKLKKLAHFLCDKLYIMASRIFCLLDNTDQPQTTKTPAPGFFYLM